MKQERFSQLICDPHCNPKRTAGSLIIEFRLRATLSSQAVALPEAANIVSAATISSDAK